MRIIAVLLLVVSLSGCASIAEGLVNQAIKNCWTFDGFSGARQCKK